MFLHVRWLCGQVGFSWALLPHEEQTNANIDFNVMICKSNWKMYLWTGSPPSQHRISCPLDPVICIQHVLMLRYLCIASGHWPDTFEWIYCIILYRLLSNRTMQLQFQNVDILNCKSDYVNMYRHLWPTTFVFGSVESLLLSYIATLI